jgi:hypothetical protein
VAGDWLVGRLGLVVCLLGRVVLKEGGSGNGWNQLLAAGRPASFPDNRVSRPPQTRSLVRALPAAAAIKLAGPPAPGPRELTGCRLGLC